MKRSWMTVGLMAILAVGAFAQSWGDAYERALEAARLQQWANARQNFKEAAALRADDQSRPTRMPGSITEARDWRNGAPYSPNFLGAYSAFRVGLQSTSKEERETMYRSAAGELEALLAKGQTSRESFYFLGLLYDKLDMRAQREALYERYTKESEKLTWRVDTEVLAPEELAVIQESTRPTPTTPSPDKPMVDVRPGVKPVAQAGTAPVLGRVPVAYDKYALIIGNSRSNIADGVVAFAAADAEALRDALVTHGGYADSQVFVLTDCTAAELTAKVKEVADMIPNEAPVFFYFTGAGVNLDGKDYLAGVDAAASGMNGLVRKSDVYDAFLAKGASLFAFYQVNRVLKDGRAFGSEIPTVGSIAQAQATVPGGRVNGYVRNGKTVGLYTDAMVNTLAKFRSNRVPVMEFGWQVFYQMRSGGRGVGGGSTQVPTLPVLTNIASNGPF
ncbi:MAG: caspase family protein [Nitrospirae bacterium]|nr:caspase family protein [Fimbriimonadaceae bacterium]